MAGRARRHNRGGGNQPRQRMFDKRREELFKWDARGALRDAPMEEQHRTAFLQQIIARGCNAGLEDAKDFVRDKGKEPTVLDPGSRDRILGLLDKYSRYR